MLSIGAVNRVFLILGEAERAIGAKRMLTLVGVKGMLTDSASVPSVTSAVCSTPVGVKGMLDAQE